MTPAEIGALLAYVDRLAPRYAPQDKASAAERYQAFGELLADVPLRAPHPDGRDWHADQAARRHLAESPYPLQASDITGPWLRFKADVLARHHDPVPTADPDNPAAWRAELGHARAAVATGTARPAPLLELLGGTRAERDAQAAAALDRLGGTYVPRTVRDAVSPSTRTVRAGQKTAGPERLPTLPALAVACPRPDCRARENRYCKRSSGAERRLSVHDERQAAYAAADHPQEHTS